VQRAVRHHAVEQSALFEEFDEERHLPEWRHRRAVVPFNMDAARESIGHDRPSRYSLYYRLITRRQAPDNSSIRSHP
jgi:hypothetical protein